MSKDGVYIVAELGVNWVGEIGVLLCMISDAAKAGADAVKVQWFRAEEVKEHPQHELLEQMVLMPSDVAELCDYAHSQGLEFVVTPMFMEAVGWLKHIPIDGVKIRAKDWANHELVEAALKLGKPTYISVPYEMGEVVKPKDMSDKDFQRALVRTMGDNVYHVVCVPKYPPEARELCLYSVVVRDGCSNHYPDWTVPFMAGYGKMLWDSVHNFPTRKRFYLEVHVQPDEIGQHAPEEVIDRDVSIYFDDLAKLTKALARGEEAVG